MSDVIVNNSIVEVQLLNSASVEIKSDVTIEVTGAKGNQGIAGLSAYEVAVENGFDGTEQEWLLSLIGETGPEGLSAYEVAVENGFDGTEQEWLLSLIGETGPEGLDGNTILYGFGAPSSSLGVDGNFYIDESIFRIFGPKTSGVWGSGLNIVGPQGPQGPAGLPTDDQIIAISLLYG